MKILKHALTKTVLFGLAIAPTLTACGGGHFDTGSSTALVLPPVIQYDRETLNRAADEAEAGQCTASVELGKDYKLTRDKLRIAKKNLENRK